MTIRIGVTGTFCAGKDTFAGYLTSKKGFVHISLSDILREHAASQGVPITRESLQKAGTELREKEGSHVLAAKAIKKFAGEEKVVITSIRNPLEVKELSQAGHFVLVSVDAPPGVRFERMASRGRKENEPDTYEKFLEAEQKELVSSNAASQQIQDCIDMAHFSVLNNGTVEELYSKIEQLFPKLEEAASHERPSWDEYFLELAKMVGKRGTCSRGRAGCVIVKQKRIMTTGYVGSPPHMAHCDDVGHWFKQTIHEDGEITQHCIRTVHAEANAIAQAAKYGITIDGGTLYCKMEPCLDCTKLAISAGIQRVVCEKRYHAAKESREMFEEAGVRLDVLHDSIEEYAGQKKLDG